MNHKGVFIDIVEANTMNEYYLFYHLLALHNILLVLQAFCVQT